MSLNDLKRARTYLYLLNSPCLQMIAHEFREGSLCTIIDRDYAERMNRSESRYYFL